MSLIIKSNQKSSQNMGSIFNIPSDDYSLLLDFSLGEYKQRVDGVTTKLSLEDAITLTRSTKATYLDANGDIKTADVNEPRIHRDGKTGKSGLLLESGFKQLLSDIYQPKTQTITVPLLVNDRLVLSVKGTGSATMSGVVTPDGGNNNIATENNPAAAKITAAGNVTVTVTGNLEAFSLTLNSALSGLGAPSFTPEGVITTAPDMCKLNSALASAIFSGMTACTIIMRTVDSNHDSNTQLRGTNTILALRDSAFNLEGVYINKTSGGGSATYAALKGNSNEQVFTRATPSGADLYVKNYIMSYKDSGKEMVIGHEGNVQSVSSLFTISPDELIIGSKNPWQSSVSLGGIVTSIIIYPRALSGAEILKLSTANNY